ncbi:hypothetical protein ANCDUO_17561 [Ancylostoma duodenale]|uniref:Uncharacterized protein n=1 Tax=Ancylostoma duodenale TaxID=51022 RepID=A0A0C2C7S5_9BILA|nr:hypothetical protein ANCDUO_17561 [Ancylostoma duodenale]
MLNELNKDGRKIVLQMIKTETIFTKNAYCEGELGRSTPMNMDCHLGEGLDKE